MKALPSIFRNGFRRRRAAGAARKRPSRSFTSTFAPLEGRALLSTIIGPVLVTPAALTATTQALLQSIAPPTIPEPMPSQEPPESPGKGQGGSPGAVGSPGAGGSRDAGHNGNPSGQGGDHVSMDVARVDVDGRETPEFALADFAASAVFVRLGIGGPTTELGPAQGVDYPESVTLADLNGDHIPDLIVANTNANNILIFQGLGGGQFGPELNGGRGIAVGVDPVNVSVNYVDGDPNQAQLIVANAESRTISLLDGQVLGGLWTPTSTGTIAEDFTLPTKAQVYDVNRDGKPDLLICDTGAGQISILTGLGNGAFNQVDPITIRVGSEPEAVLIGSFERHNQTDLVTVNAGSDDLTFVANVFGLNPITQTIPSGGTSPDAAFAVDPTHSGIMDLVVANGGDGRLAVFQGGDSGLQLAGVITQAGVPSPTALAPGSSGGEGLDFFAASAGNDSALLLHFDLGVASTYLPGSSEVSGGIGQGDSDLFAQLMPFDGSSLDLIAVLWSGSPDGEAASAMSSLREPATLTVLYSPTEGQGDDEPGRLPEAPVAPKPTPVDPANPPRGGNSVWAMVSGVDEVMGRPRRFGDALASRDLLDEDGNRPSPVEGLVRLDLDLSGTATDGPLDADLEAIPGILGGDAIRLLGPEATPGDASVKAKAKGKDEAGPPVDPPGEPGPGEAEPPEIDGGLDSVPLVSSAVLLSARLLIKASPPRPPSRRGPGWLRRFVSPRHDPRTPNGPNP